MDRERASYFTVREQELLVAHYEELKDTIRKKGNTSAINKEKVKAWQTIADRLNAADLSGQKRTWQQVKTKYKNIVQSAVRRKTHKTGTGGGPPSQELTPAEELPVGLNKGRPEAEMIQGGTVTDSPHARESGSFLRVSGDTVPLLQPPEDDPGEGTSAAVEYTSADEETLSSRMLEDPETAQPQKQAGNINPQTTRVLYAEHLQKQTELTQLKIQRQKRSLELMELDIEIKRRTLRKLDVEIQKVEHEAQS